MASRRRDVLVLYVARVGRLPRACDDGSSGAGGRGDTAEVDGTEAVVDVGADGVP